jgi:hypothetical protein
MNQKKNSTSQIIFKVISVILLLSMLLGFLIVIFPPSG